MKNITLSESIYRTFCYMLTFLLVFIMVVPIFNVFITSFISEAEIARRGSFILWPENFEPSAYNMVFRSPNIWRGFRNTSFIVLVGTSLSMLFSIAMAYPLSKKRLWGRNAILGMMTFTMLFSGGMVPTYLTLNAYGVLDTRWAFILPTMISTWNTLLLRNFFYSIPESLEEAALLDGATQIQIILRVVLPLSLPSIATIGMFYGVGYWNSWFPGAIYITDSKLQPIQNVMRTIVESATAGGADMDVSFDAVGVIPPSAALKSATIIVSTVPILVVYPFIQKYFVAGVMVGSVKG